MNGKFKHRRTLFICAFFCVILSSCAKTKFDDLTFNESDRTEDVIAFKNEEFFKGTAWAKDGKSAKITTNEMGAVLDVTIYYPNGQECIFGTICTGGEYNYPNYRYYDKEGNPMNEEHWENSPCGEYAFQIFEFYLPEIIQEHFFD